MFGCTQNPQEIQNNKTNSTNNLTNLSTNSCGKDFDCFIAKAQNCSPSSVEYIFNINVFGVVQKTSSLLEIKGPKENLCTFYMKYGNSEVKFSNELRDQLLKTFSAELIASKEAEATSKSNELISNKEGTCEFQSLELTSMLQKWKSGSYSFGMENGKAVGDFKNALNCRGSLFDGNLISPIPQKIELTQSETIQKDSIVLSTEKSSYTLANSASGINIDSSKKTINIQGPKSTNLQFAFDIKGELPTDYSIAKNYVFIVSSVDAQLSGTYYELGSDDKLQITVEKTPMVGEYFIATFSGSLTKKANQTNNDLQKIHITGGKLILKRIN